MENDPKLRLAPPEPDIGPVIGGFIDPDDTSEENKNRPKDIFGYAEYGSRLANIVRNLQTPLVLALTGGWGSGKSVFAKQWAGELQKSENTPVIYFDAFANDHQKNALFALAGEVMEFIGRRKKMAGKAGESIARIGKGVSGTLAECAARFATLGAAGVGDVSKAMKTALDKRMEDAEKERDAVKKFRDALENAAKELGGGQPLVFIVDELDRCRPDFALELLEKIKHLFSVPGVCFLVVTNLEKFVAVIQRTYGYSKQDAETYLEKFFPYVFWLPEGGKHGDGQIVDYVHHLWKILLLPSAQAWEFSEWLKGLSQTHDFSLRDIERMLAPIVLAYAGGGIPREDRLYRLAAILCVLRKIDSVAYRKILQSAADWEDMPELLKNNSGVSLDLALIKGAMSARETSYHQPTLFIMVDTDAKSRKEYVAGMAKIIENYAQ